MVLRLIMAFSIFAVLGAGYTFVLGHQKKKATNEAKQSGLIARDIPTILYFTTDMCAPCKLVQTPAIEQLKDELGAESLKVVTIDAIQDSDEAEKWGVMTTPTTIVLDTERKPRFVNNRVAQAHQLREQIAAL